MQISSVRAHLLSYALPQPIHLTYHCGERTILKRDAMLIRVEADNGLVGYAPGQGSERAKEGIESVIASFLEGRTLGDPDALRVQFVEAAGRQLDLQKLYCAVEIALYDLLGKAKGVPVSELLGGRVRDRIRLYGSAGMYMAPEKYAEEALAISKLGFRAYKMRSGIGPEKDLDTVRLMRDAVGPDFDLMVDAHTWWRIGYRRLKELELVPIASGEHEPDDPGYLDLIRTSSVDFVQMDIVCQGGYLSARRMLPEIARNGLKFAFHSWGTALEVIAAAHLGICWPEQVVEWLEYPCYSTPSRAGMYPFPLAADVLKEPLDLDHGDLLVPSGPGLGVEIDESVIQRYPWIPGPWSFFMIDSPRETRAVTADHSEPWLGDRP